MPTCSFCKKNYKEPRGLTVFTFDGRSVYFCSGKCRKNLDLGRDPKKVNWVKREKKVGISKSKETAGSESKVSEKSNMVEKPVEVKEKKEEKEVKAEKKSEKKESKSDKKE